MRKIITSSSPESWQSCPSLLRLHVDAVCHPKRKKVSTFVKDAK